MRPALCLAISALSLAACAPHVQKSRQASSCYPLSCAAPHQGAASIHASAAQAHRQAQSLPGTEVSVAGQVLRMRRVRRNGADYAVFSQTGSGYGAAQDLSTTLVTTAPQLTGCRAASDVWHISSGGSDDYTVRLTC